MNIANSTRLAVVSIGSLLLAACGGGSSNTTPPPVQSAPAPVVITPAPASTISGVFNGTTDSGQAITALLQEDGSYFIVYSDAAAPQTALGAITGTGALTGVSFSSSNGLGLTLVGTGAQTPQAVTLSASYTQQQSFNGSLTYSSGGKVTTFTTVYNNPYATLPSLAALAGVYTGTIATKDMSEDNLMLTIGLDGTLTGQLTCGCKVNATLTPRADGKAYVATLAMVGGDHVLSNKTVAGNVYLDAVHKRLYIVGNIVGTTEGAIFVGSKP